MSGERKVLLAAGGTGGHMFPAEALAHELLARGVAEETLKELDKRIRATVSAAAEFAENSPEPDLPELYTDVLVERY